MNTRFAFPVTLALLATNMHPATAQVGIRPADRVHPGDKHHSVGEETPDPPTIASTDVAMPAAGSAIVQQDLPACAKQPTRANPFNIHPNPATDRIEVVTEGDGLKTYRLMTTEGKVMQQGRLNGQRASLPIEFIEAGVYILEVRDGKRVQQQHLIKQ